MKRRKFLGLFGAAAATPFLPAPAMAKAAKVAPYSAAAVHAAIIHAQSRAVFSVWGLARALNVSAESAEALMHDLSQRGVLGPLQGTTFGGRWASSRVMTSEAISLRAARKAARQPSEAARQLRGDDHAPMSTMMAHLQRLAADYFAAKGAVA